MINRLPQPLIELASVLPYPLYVVGGCVRDFLSGNMRQNPDYDICSCGDEQSFLAAAVSCRFTVQSTFHATGTVKLKDENANEYEYTRWRSDKYVRGMHRPAEVCFTDDITLDARRRDFCANAVYYDIKRRTFVDPLGGIDDINRKLLRTVAPAQKVFGEDGLRLLRLARIAAQNSFSPDTECMEGAKANARLIRDVVPERIFAELNALLHADDRSKDASSPYRGLKILQQTGVLHEILPELTAGEGMQQRKDFHNYDVLEHSLRCVLYAPPSVRWAALLHDVGKPYCMLRDGNFYAHDAEGERIARDVLTRLKAPKKLCDETAMLTKLHMRDYAHNMRTGKVRKELAASYTLLDKLFALKQADYTACKDDPSPAPSVVKWKGILADMKREGAPLCLKELNVNGNDLIKYGIQPKDTGHVLNTLFEECVLNGNLNTKEKLLRRAKILVAFK